MSSQISQGFSKVSHPTYRVEEIDPQTLAKLKDHYKDIKALGPALEQAPAILATVTERIKFIQACEEVICASYAMAVKYDLEGKLWKIGIYPFVDFVRKKLPEATAEEETHMVNKFDAFTLEARRVYERIVEAICRHSHRTTKSLSEPPAYFKSLGYLGDLARYRAMYCFRTRPGNTDAAQAQTMGMKQRSEWAEAKHRYHNAVFVSVNNGLYHHQLGLVAMQAELYLVALSHYLKALTVRAPYNPARESLVTLFQINENRLRSVMAKGDTRSSTKSSKASGSTKLQPSPAGGDAIKRKLREPGPTEIECQFIWLHQILHTRVNLDLFEEGQARLLYYLKAHIDKQNSPLDFKYWMYIATATMAVVWLKGKSPYDNISTEVAAGHAMSLLLSLFELGVRSCVKAGSANPRSSASTSSISSQVSQTSFIAGSVFSKPCMAYVEAVLFLLVNLDEAWRPLILTKASSDLWRNLARIANWALEFLKSWGITLKDLGAHQDLVPSLAYDWESRGFTPFKAITHSTKRFDMWMAHSNKSFKDIVDEIMAPGRSVDRPINKSTENERSPAPEADVPCNVTSAQLVIAKRIVWCLTWIIPWIHGLEIVEDQIIFQPQEIQDVDIANDGYSKSIPRASNDCDDAPDDGERDMDDGLPKKMAKSINTVDPNMSRPRGRAKAETNLSHDLTCYIFDTNCWLSDLAFIQNVVEAGWKVVLPLAVLTELNGLANARDDRQLNSDVAVLAVAYLESLYRNPTKAAATSSHGRIRISSVPHSISMMKVVTSHGHWLPDLGIRAESWSGDDRGLNSMDDVILHTCKILSTNSLGKQYLLITNDGNLRLKARASNVTVHSMRDLKRLFASWDQGSPNPV
ncbi:hypothetical protein SeMB42_g02464 [Synchytrium endobioticum]|uniref:PIN domain-containing protein n=1 Tax=Synchytrium endobioticum TaxID=286115 RepID=A0A507DDP8_9FUNG|nr:hypothetical protein SeLEV6574_g01832 [Synchytrium endobioticum]TPX49819.1 hypothetical protein SeMB42_g02464 [Synchytrium endobioticum]